MTYKFTENTGYNTFKKLPKFDGDGSSINVHTVIFAAIWAFIVTKYNTLGCSQISFKTQLLMKN